MSFANLKFRDVFSELNAGLPPAVYAVGSSAGSPISMTGTGKLLFHLDQGSGGAGSSRLSFYGAPASTGVGSTLFGSTAPLYASATSASGGTIVAEIRGAYIQSLGLGPWVIPVLTVAGASVVAGVHANGFVCNYQPASNNDVPASYVSSEPDLL